MIRWDLVSMAAAALVVGVLGALHLLYTFAGRKLLPRDPALQQRMAEVSPWISRDTTMWKAWTGFNASHSLGALLFGLVYGWLAMRQGAVLFASPLLVCVGAAYLGAMAALGWRYWFRIPFGGLLLACALYATSVAVAWT